MQNRLSDRPPLAATFILAQTRRDRKQIPSHLDMGYNHAIMGIQDAIRSVPARPGIFLVLGVTFLFGGWHYYTQWQACEIRAKAAAQIRTAIDIARENQAIVDLGQIFAFPWDEVLAIADHSPGRNALSCPFGFLGGSHWSLAEREKMAQDRRLAALSFYHQGREVAFVEYLKEWGEFQSGNEPIPRERARFRLLSVDREKEGPRLQLTTQPR